MKHGTFREASAGAGVTISQRRYDESNWEFMHCRSQTACATTLRQFAAAVPPVSTAFIVPDLAAIRRRCLSLVLLSTPVTLKIEKFFCSSAARARRQPPAAERLRYPPVFHNAHIRSQLPARRVLTVRAAVGRVLPSSVIAVRPVCGCVPRSPALCHFSPDHPGEYDSHECLRRVKFSGRTTAQPRKVFWKTAQIPCRESAL